MRSFKCVERNIWPGAREIEVAGELDLAVSGQLRAALERAVAKEESVLVDLTACEFIDVGGLAILVDCHGMLQDRGCQLLLYGVRGQVRRMFSITGLADPAEGSTVAPARWPRAEEPRPAFPDRFSIRQAPTSAPLREVSTAGSRSIR